MSLTSTIMLLNFYLLYYCNWFIDLSGMRGTFEWRDSYVGKRCWIRDVVKCWPQDCWPQQRQTSGGKKWTSGVGRRANCRGLCGCRGWGASEGGGGPQIIASERHYVGRNMRHPRRSFVTSLLGIVLPIRGLPRNPLCTSEHNACAMNNKVLTSLLKNCVYPTGNSVLLSDHPSQLINFLGLLTILLES